MQRQQHQHACGTNQGIKPPTCMNDYTFNIASTPQRGMNDQAFNKASSPQLIEHRLSGHQAPNLYMNGYTFNEA